MTIPRSIAVKPSNSGKGLYAAAAIQPNTELFKEKPLIWVPDVQSMGQHILGGLKCAYCGKVFGQLGQSLRVKCRFCTQGSVSRSLCDIDGSLVHKKLFQERCLSFFREQLPDLSKAE